MFFPWGVDLVFSAGGEALPLLLHGLVCYEMQTRYIRFTPRYISVSSKHVLSLFDDGNRVTFPITPAVECTDSPAVSGGAVTQHPLRVTSNCRLQELTKVTVIKCVASYYH